MLKESIKWIILSLLVAALVFSVAYWGVSALGKNAPADIAPSPSALLDSPTPSVQSPAPSPAPTPSPTPVPPDTKEQILAYVQTLSTEEKLGQLVLFGGSGTDTPGGDFSDILSTYQVGNLILYGNNIASGDQDGGFGRASTLISRMKETMTTDIPPLVAIDLEGGKVVRFGWDTWPDSAYTLGKKNDPDHAYRQFQDIGNKLLETGFNTNLAPVLDITTSPMDSFLGTRIISGDPQVAGSIGGAIIRGLHGAGCLSVAKHFPGHGGTTKDSHDVTPVVNRTAEELRAYDLLPFQAAVEAGVDAVLVAHILYPALDETDIASMSEPIITGLLRNELGFTGVVVSDDFRMGGLTSRYSVEDAAVRFLLAGGDLIMCGIQPDRQRRIMEGLRDAAASGRLPAERIDESVTRVLNMKLSAGLWTLP